MGDAMVTMAAGTKFRSMTPSPATPDDSAQFATASLDFSTLDFSTLVRQHQAMVFSIALHSLRNHPAAEEVAQDVFLQLHAKLESLDSEDHVKFWLRRVTSHRCIDYLRRHKLPPLSAIPIDEIPEPAAKTPELDPLMSRKLTQVIASLPEKPRMVMILRYQEDMTAEEISDALGMPVATVRSHVQRSLTLLREKLTAITSRRTGGTK